MTPSQKSEYEKQKERQQKWQCKAGRNVEEKAWLLMNAEYSDRGQRQSARQENLTRYFKFITRAIPYYRDRLDALSNSQEDVFEYLYRCPVLTKTLLRDHSKHLVAKELPEGHKVVGQTSSSGTTCPQSRGPSLH